MLVKSPRKSDRSRRYKGGDDAETLKFIEEDLKSLVAKYEKEGAMYEEQHQQLIKIKDDLDQYNINKEHDVEAATKALQQANALLENVLQNANIVKERESREIAQSMTKSAFANAEAEAKSEADDNQEEEKGGAKRKSKANKKTLRKGPPYKKRGGADLSVGSDNYASVFSTGDLLSKDFQVVPPANPWNTPSPFSSGSILTTNLLERLPNSFVSAIDSPVATTGGGKKKTAKK